MASLREILVTFGVEFDTSPIEHGESKIEGLFGKVSELGKLLAEAFVVKEIYEFTHELVEQADAMDHMAVATGLNTQELQAWQLGAAEADVDAQAFGVSLRKLSLALSGGGDEAGTGAKLFKDLKIATKDANGEVRGLGDVLPEISEHFKGMSDGAEKSALATKLFGRQGSQLIPLLNKGANGIKDLRIELDELGGGFSPDFIEQASKVDENMKRLNQAWTSTKVKIGGFFLPALDSAVRGLTKLAGVFGRLAQSSNLVQAAIVTLGAFAAVKAGVLIASWWPVIAPFLAWAAAIAVIVLLVDDLITAWQGGDSVIGRIIDKIWGPGSTAKVVGWFKTIGNGFAEMFSTASNHSEEFHLTWAATLADIENDTDSFGGYWSGFLAAAVDVFFGSVNAMTGGWETFGNFLAGIIEGLGFSFQVVWDDIKFAGLGVAAALSDAFDNFVKHLGPIKTLADKLGIDLGAGNGTAGAGVDSDRAANTQRRLAQGEDILDKVHGTGKYAPTARATGGTGASTTNVVTNVTVPPGTPASVARAAGAAAEHGATRGARAAGVPLKNPNRAAAAALRGPTR